MDDIREEIRLLDKNFDHKRRQVVRQIDNIKSQYNNLKRVYEHKRAKLVERQEFFLYETHYIRKK